MSYEGFGSIGMFGKVVTLEINGYLLKSKILTIYEQMISMRNLCVTYMDILTTIQNSYDPEYGLTMYFYVFDKGWILLLSF